MALIQLATVDDLVKWSQQYDRVTERFALYTSLDSAVAKPDGTHDLYVMLRPTVSSKLDTAYVIRASDPDEMKRLRDNFKEFFGAFQKAGRYFAIESFKFRED